MELAQTWYLMKNEDDSIFGPISFEQLRQWALDAQVSPLDKVSNDQKTWVKAPMVPELEMDYLVEVTPDQFYGPTTIGAVREFLQAGEINGDSPVTNCRDGSMKRVSEMPELQLRDEEEPVRTSIRVNLQQRVRDLETALMEERRAREQAEHLVEKLEAKIAGITRAAAL
jgi:peptidoglycan hydrolase-like protein with peptidoglycan-binding domain